MATSYVKDSLDTCLSGGVDDELKELAARDAALFDHVGVADERQRNLALYTDFFADDMAAEVGRTIPKDRMAFIKAVFEDLCGREDVDLTDIRRAVFKALGMTRKAYHNTMGLLEDNTKPQRDLGKWIKTLGEIFAAERAGETRNRAVARSIKEWPRTEQTDFSQWIRYYEKGDHEKYGLKITAAKEERMPPGELMRKELTMQEQGQPEPQQQQQPPVRRRRGRPPRTAPKTHHERKTFITGRLDAIRRELRQFVGVWPTHVLNDLYSTLNELDQQIMSLQTVASMNDCLIRTATIWERHGVTAGAQAIRRIAQPPRGGEDVVSQIEKALTGREYETEAPPPPGGAGMEGLPPPPTPEDLGMPPAGGGPGPEAPGGEPMGSPPPEAMEGLPEAPEPPKPEKEEKELPGKDENPYSGSSARDVLDVLEPLSSVFKERETVRKLSKVDMMMDGLGIVSYFPELGEVIARLIETDSYVSTRLEKIMNKLRGGMREGEEEEKGEAPPAIEMGSAPTEEAGAEAIEAPRAEETGAEAVEAPPAPAAEETAAEAVEVPAAPAAPAAPGV